MHAPKHGRKKTVKESANDVQIQNRKSSVSRFEILADLNDLEDIILDENQENTPSLTELMEFIEKSVGLNMGNRPSKKKKANGLNGLGDKTSVYSVKASPVSRLSCLMG